MQIPQPLWDDTKFIEAQLKMLPEYMMSLPPEKKSTCLYPTNDLMDACINRLRELDRQNFLSKPVKV